MMQETKLKDEDAPHGVFRELGYELVHHGEGRWNGVAIASRCGVANVVTNFGQPLRHAATEDAGDDEPLAEARMLSAECAGVRVVSLYAPNGRVVGSTSYLNISRGDRGLEIGSTWLGRPWQRTGINTEAKYLLLRHAFEDLGAVRVQLKTDARNLQSQAAIERLGAVREGVLRKHMLVRDGHLRDSVMYSVTDDEWPAVKTRLEVLVRP